MKKNKLIHILLLLLLSFYVSHAFVIEHEHHGSDITEYTDEFSHTNHDDLQENEHCDFHCEFHIPYIMTDAIYIKSTPPISLSINLKPFTYIYYPSENFLKPPIS